MESMIIVIYFRRLIGLLLTIFNYQQRRWFKFVIIILFLSFGSHFFLSSLCAQGPGLYKDGKKILDLEEVITPSPADLQKSPILTKGRELRKQVLGTENPDRFKEQNEYITEVLKCRNLVQIITDNLSKNSSFTNELDQLLASEQNLILANQALLNKFSQIETSLKNSGYPQEKIDRHIKMVEHHGIAAQKLLDLLARLKEAHTTGEQSNLKIAIQELNQYFLDNIFQQDPPLLSSQPLPVMMSKIKAPVVQRDELPPLSRNTYPVVPEKYLGYDPADLNPTIDVQFTTDIISMATTLHNSPTEIYSFVRENFEFEPYLGSRKGSQQTLDHRRGNDYDQASLLIALLRVSGIPARYATNTIEMPIEQATNWLGIDDPVNAGSILTTAGMQGVLVYMGPDPVAIRCRRVWVEAWIPFINYRGAVNDSVGFTWVPLDPTFKQYTYKSGINLPAEMGFDAESFVEEYYSSFHTQTPAEMFKQRLLDSLSVRHPGAVYEDLLTTRSVIKETDGILPGTLPYELIAQDSVFSEIPSDKRYRVRFYLHDDFGMVLDYSTSLPEIVGKQVTISYVGATPSDQYIIDTAGGIFNVQHPYLVDLKPVLKIDGCEVARANGSIMMGVTHYSDMHFTAPTGAQNQMPTVSNTIIAGNYQGIGLDTEDAIPAMFGAPHTACEENTLGQEQHQLALTYLNNVDVADDDIGDLMHIVVMNDVSEAIVENSVTVYFTGDYPSSMNWTGMIVDADRKIIGPFSVDGIDNSCDYMRLGGADGSIQENRLFENRFEEEAISAIKILELASDSGINICEITHKPISEECPGFSHPQSVRDAVNAALDQGHHVIIPERGFKYYEWSGTGYIDIDPVTCAAGYIISGGQNGGATVQVWTIPWYMWLSNIRCTKGSGTVTVTPPRTDDLYCADSWDFWTFTVPQIDYYSKDKNGNCFIKYTEPNKKFHVRYPVRFIAWIWGPGEYVFTAGSPGECTGCGSVEKKVTIVKAEIKAVTFTSDHGLLTDYNSDFAGAGGAPFNPRGWQSGSFFGLFAKNNPVSHTKGLQVSANVVAKVEPSGVTFDLEGTSAALYFRFVNTGVVSTGEDQTISVTSQGQLPNAIGIHDNSIDWKIKVGSSDYCDDGSSGPHKIYVTWGNPGPGPTLRRIDWVCSSARDASSPYDIADMLQDAVHDGTTFGNTTAEGWALLDGGSGLCDYLAGCMELAYEMSGAGNADVVRVHASTDPAPGNCLGPRPEEIRDEWTWYLDLYFYNASPEYKWNKFEGCCVAANHYWAIEPEIDASNDHEMLCAIECRQYWIRYNTPIYLPGSYIEEIDWNEVDKNCP